MNQNLLISLTSLIIATVVSCKQTAKQSSGATTSVDKQELVEQSSRDNQGLLDDKTTHGQAEQCSLSQIEMEFAKLPTFQDNPDFFRKAFTQLWDSQTCDSLKRSLDDTEFKIRSKEEIPTSYEKLLEDADKIGSQMETGRFAFTESNDEFQIVINRTYLAINIIRSGNISLTDLIAEEAIRFQGTRMEVVNFFVFSLAMRELAVGEGNLTNYSGWNRVASAGSKIWQHIAIQGAARSTPSTIEGNKEGLIFFNKFLLSESAMLQNEALIHLGDFGSQEAETVIQKAIDSKIVRDTSTLQTARESIRKSKFIRELRESRH